MASLKIPYETAEETGVFLSLDVPDNNLFIECVPQEPGPIQDLTKTVEEAVESPVEGARFSELIKGGKNLTFLIENQFRAAPVRDILPDLVDRAKRAGCNISIIIGCGKVPPLTPEEIEMKVGKALAKSGIPIVCNDVTKPENYRYVGITRSGTPIFIHKVVADADVRVSISTTQATLWGYGGSGMINPAVAGNQTIETNHVMALAPDCIPGNNDCRMQQDKYEALDIATVKMGINVIVDNHDRVIYLNAGSPVESHKRAVQSYDETYEFSVPDLNRKKADIAITGSSAPTNHLFFHTSWAIVNCDPAVRDGGVIIQATPCPGYGDWPGFALMDLMKPYLPASHENLVKALQDFYTRETELWAACIWYKIYEVMTRKQVWIVTDGKNIPFCQEIGLTAFESIEQAFSQAMEKSGKDAQIAFIPYGRYTIVRP
jgi:nickel-dependent lactate racemase